MSIYCKQCLQASALPAICYQAFAGSAFNNTTDPIPDIERVSCSCEALSDWLMLCSQPCKACCQCGTTGSPRCRRMPSCGLTGSSRLLQSAMPSPSSAGRMLLVTVQKGRRSRLLKLNFWLATLMSLTVNFSCQSPQQSRAVHRQHDEQNSSFQSAAPTLIASISSTSTQYAPGGNHCARNFAN